MDIPMNQLLTQTVPNGFRCDRSVTLRSSYWRCLGDSHGSLGAILNGGTLL